MTDQQFTPAATRKPTPPWLFALLGTPYGVVGSFSTVVVPFVARKADIDLGGIGWLVFIMFIPTMTPWLYSPIVDLGLRRKHWLIIVAALAAVCLLAACMLPLPSALYPFVALAFAGQLISGLVGSCTGALMATTIPDDKRGAAGAWYNVGNLVGGGFSAAVAVYLMGHDFDPRLVGVVLAAWMLLPACAALTIDEPKRDSKSVRAAFGGTLTEVGRVITSKSGITGILLCLSPVGTAVLGNLFSAIAFDYVEVTPEVANDTAIAAVQHLLWVDPSDALKLAHDTLLDLAKEERASELVALLQGLLGLIPLSIGSLLGGVLCDRYNRRGMYLLAGALTAVVGIAMALASRSELTLWWGVLCYQLVTGICYSAFTATVLDTIGSGEQGAATKYTLFVAAGNAAIAWVGLANTRFSAGYGVEGVIFSDAMLNIAGVVVLGLAFWYLGLFRSKPDATPAT